MDQRYLFEILIIPVLAVVIGHCYDVEKKRDLTDIRYRFTSCGTSGRSGPSISTCQKFYTDINSPIMQQDLLFEFEDREYEGAQGFRVPKNGLYNITVAAAGGGRGICNYEQGGYGYQRTVQVELSTDYELLILVGQRGTSPCDVIPEDDETYATFCQESIIDIAKCNETWYNFTTDFDHMFYNVFGGGAGGGGTLVRARNKNTDELDGFPIAIVGGGGGSASVLDYDAVDEIGTSNTFLPTRILSYRTFVNGKFRSSSGGFSAIGVRGTRRSSSNIVAGAGGGYRVGFLQSISKDGRALGSPQDFAKGGLDCTESFVAAGHNFPYSGVHGGFGGGGGACGGGGGGGGYTGGSILANGVTIPGGGGYSYVGDDFATSFAVHTTDDGRLSGEHDNGFVEIILADCGCVHECLVNSTEDTFQCLCPNNTMLARDLSDCYESEDISVNEESLNLLGDGLYYKFVELENSTIILSNDMYIQSNNEVCILFWLGEDLQIVLSTNVVRGSGRISTLAMVDDNIRPSSPIYTLLTSSVLVTGALLVGTGDCTVVGNTISVNASIQTPSSGIISAEDFINGNISAVMQRASALALALFLEPDAAIILNRATIASTVVLTVVLFIAIFATISIVAYRKKVSSDKVARAPISAARYKECLVLNLSYSQIDAKSVSLQSFTKSQDGNPYYHEVLSHVSEDKDAISPSEVAITPVHGITCPPHDFTSFNKQRRNTLIIDSVWDYPRDNLVYMRELGEGQFGKVLLMKAKDIAGYTGHIPVAVKTLTSRDPEVIKKFHEEANLMKMFSHPNIVSLLGFIQEEQDEDSAPLMVLEFMQYGDLGSFMKSHRPVDGQLSVIGEANFVAFSADIAKGLEFLSSMKYVHRDIAARNCLVGAGLRIKIADFGLARAVHNKDYYKVDRAAVLPIRWMAPESLLFGVFSVASDIWSYGVLLWEIVTYGKLPLVDISVEDIIDAARNQVLSHTRPPNCPDSLNELMSECLEHNSEDRPAAADIVSFLSKLNNVTEMDVCS